MTAEYLERDGIIHGARLGDLREEAFFDRSRP